MKSTSQYQSQLKKSKNLENISIDSEIQRITNDLQEYGGSQSCRIEPIHVILNVLPAKQKQQKDEIKYSIQLKDTSTIMYQHQNKTKEHTFDQVFYKEEGNAKLVDYFVEQQNSLISEVFMGFNVALISFGASGLGKSKLLFGKDNRYKYMEESSDLVSRMICKLLEKGGSSIQLGVSGFQIYKENGQEIVNDVLADINDSSYAKDFVNIRIITTDQIKSVFDSIKAKCMNWTFSKKDRMYSQCPNRSHLFIRVMVRNLTEQTSSCIYIVDSIGFKDQLNPRSGRNEKNLFDYSNFSYEQIKKIINELIIQAEVKKSRFPKPFYDKSSKYSQFISPLLAGNCKTYLLCSACCEGTNKSIGTYLEIAEKTKKIMCGATKEPINKQTGSFVRFSQLYICKQFQ